MVQTFSGYFQEGRFISSQTAAIPEYVEVVIVVTDKPIANINSQSQTSKEYTNILPSTDPLGETDNKIIRQRRNTIKNPRLLREPDPIKSIMLGKWNGEVKVPDDFDEPLEEMKEYMY